MVVYRDLETARRIRKSVAASLSGLAKRSTRADVIPTESVPEFVPEAVPLDGDVFAAMPRRQQVTAQPRDDYGLIPNQDLDPVVVSPFATLRRLLVWIRVLGRYLMGTLWDMIRRRSTEERSAVRLRQAFERAGGTLVKIGQQMSIRLDLLPPRICQELALMLDHAPPFPVAEAIEAVERAIGQKLEAVFSAFDPEPIGSASIACVYQAVLRETGEKVAVKVRRPRIRETFYADFRVLDFLTIAGEWLTIVRPGFVKNVRNEFRTTLASELNFRREARLQELFRRRSKKVNKQFFTAPRVYTQYSNDEVLVQEFVSGMWLSEVLSAIEQGDEVARARMVELNIEPKLVARRLLYVNNWGLFSQIAFHADPHPANIVVRANSELVFIDFGACGFLDSARRLTYQRVYDAYFRDDPYEMAKSSITSVEPFPPVDINSIMQEVETIFQDQFLVMKSKHTAWYERTTATPWLRTLTLLTKYNIPAPTDVLMFARASLLYDTLAARLDPKINLYAEFDTFGKDYRRKARKRVMGSLSQRRRGPTGGDYEAIGKIAATVNGLVYRFQRLAAAPYDFTLVSFTIEKWVFTLLTVIRFAVRSTMLLIASAALEALSLALSGKPIGFSTALSGALANPLFQAGIVILAIIHLRTLFNHLRGRSMNR